MVKGLDDAVQFLNDVLTFQNDVLAADELTERKYDQIGVDVTLAELPKDVQKCVVIVVAKSDLVEFLVEV